MANGDGDQSKRPPLSQHDSDSQVSDKGHHHGHHRSKATKHHVGGRLHARIPSSKSLHKSHGATSSTKLSRRQGQASPVSPDPALFAFPPTGPLSHGGGHRRATSDVNLSREASATNLLLKKNSSHSSLKRNRSKVEIIGKKSKSSTSLGLHHSNRHNHGKAANQVHFNLGDDDEEENPEDEWVDASTSASPLLSRRTSVVSGGQQSTASSAGNSRPSTTSSDQQALRSEPSSSPRLHSARSVNGTESPHTASTSQHNQYLTSRVLERTPAQAAPPTMSTETASVRPTPSRAHSPDRDSDALPSPMLRTRPGSSGNKPELTSRFMTNDSFTSGSGSNTGPDSFTGALARAAHGRLEAVPPEVRRLKSAGIPSARSEEDVRFLSNSKLRNGNVTDQDDDGIPTIDPKKSTSAYAMNRTQQKINLQRASSSLEPSIPPHHPALALASPAAVQGGYRGETVLPRLLERTGMEYLVVRRYQNPIARSLARLAQMPGQEKRLRIPKQRGTSTPAHSRQGSELRGGPVQNLRDREAVGGPHGLIGGKGERRPASRRGTNGDGAAEDSGTPASASGMGLSGSSLVDGGEDASTMAILRNLWDKNMDLSASQD